VADPLPSYHVGGGNGLQPPASPPSLKADSSADLVGLRAVAHKILVKDERRYSAGKQGWGNSESCKGSRSRDEGLGGCTANLNFSLMEDALRLVTPTL
jgi:hypothetical protein